jgi:hypothetical protein
MSRPKIPLDQRTHGTNSTYKAGCRCEPCTKAASAYAKERRLAREAGDIRTSTGERTHGARSTYKAGCRCKPCTEAQSAYNAKKRNEVVEAEPAPVVLDEIRIPASCLNCGAKFVQQTDSAVSGSGRRTTCMLRCSSCGRQEQVIVTLMSLSGAEYMGAA